MTENPGLQHISEQIFLNLNNENLLKCQQVNKDWEQIINNPTFWLKKCVQRRLTDSNAVSRLKSKKCNLEKPHNLS